MADDDSMSEGFSASEDEWKPTKNVKGGESSDDDDSDFEETPKGGISGTVAVRKRDEPKARSAAKQTSSKKRISLRAKLYNKYRPPPKTFSPPSSGVIGINSPSASTSRTNSKNAVAPNESKRIRRKNTQGDVGGNDTDSSSGSSIENYLVHPKDLDVQSSFFNVEARPKKTSVSPVPVFDCNAGLGNLTDSESGEDEAEDKKQETKVYNFQDFFDNINNQEQVKETLRIAAEESALDSKKGCANIDTLDVNAVLALGENLQNRSHNDGEDEDDEDDGGDKIYRRSKAPPSKRHTKTRPTSTVAAADTDDSDFEEVQDISETIDTTATSSDISSTGCLEIYIDLPSKNREKKTKAQQDQALKRKLNRDIKERQRFYHKASLLCHFGRNLFYNRLLNDTSLMEKTLKLLPSTNAYPPDRGTEIKYYQSLVTWFKTAISLTTQNLYPKKSAARTKAKAKEELLQQIEKKKARSKQDMIFIFIILLRGMGLQCRLIVNMQPLPLKPAQTDLFTIKMKNEDESELKETNNIAEKPKGPRLTNKTEQLAAKEQTVDKSKDFDKNITSCPRVVKSADEGQTKSCPIIVKQCKKDTEETPKSADKLKEKSKSGTKAVKPTKKATHELNEKEKNSKTNPAKPKILASAKSSTTSENEVSTARKQQQKQDTQIGSHKEELESSQKENTTKSLKKPSLARLKRTKATDAKDVDEPKSKQKPIIETGALVIPKIVIKASKKKRDETEQPTTSRQLRSTRSSSRSKSPQAHISTAFLLQGQQYQEKFPGIIEQNRNTKPRPTRAKSPINKVKISSDFLKNPPAIDIKKRVLKSRQKTNESPSQDADGSKSLQIPQLDGTDDDKRVKSKNYANKRPNIKQINVQRSTEDSEEDFEPSPPKKPKTAPAKTKPDRRVLSTDDDDESKVKKTAGDMWVEVWSDVEEQWICVDIFKGKLHCVDTIRKSASPNLAYVFAFQNDLSIKDVTARYCPNWTNTVRKFRVEKSWLDTAISKYLGRRTKRDINEDQELRRIHEQKPMPTAIGDYKNHPFYALERHLLKFEVLYPPQAPPLGYIRGEAVYSRDCVHTCHSRDIWLKQARTVKLGEKPYKIVKARPKWDRITQTVIKDQPLEIFGYWQTQEYEPPTAENGLVPRNAYGNVELFKACMLPKKTVHLRLAGLNRICKKLNVDCANAVVGFDFHQGSCHPTYDGFIVCEEFQDQVVAAWYQDQEEQELKDQEKQQARVYGNWKKLIRGVLIGQRLKLKYNL